MTFIVDVQRIKHMAPRSQWSLHFETTEPEKWGLKMKVVFKWKNNIENVRVALLICLKIEESCKMEGS